MIKHLDEQKIGLATDAVIFSVIDGKLMALLIQMKKEPFAGMWAFPGGLLENDETAEQAVRRILEQQTGVSRAYLEQLAVFDDPQRDPFGRVISLAYFALISADGVKLRTTDKYSGVRWTEVGHLPKLAYDHKRIAEAALKRLRERLMYSDIAWSLLPDSFTLTELQTVHEAILGETIDKRNFRKKVLALGLLKPLRRQATGRHRPARLYRFADRQRALAEIDKNA